MKTPPSGADALDVAMSKACIHSWDQSQFTSGDCDAVHPMFSRAFEAGYRAALSAAQDAPAGPTRQQIIDWLDALDIEVTDKQLAGLFDVVAMETTQEAPACLSKSGDPETQSALLRTDAPQCRLAALPVAQDAPAVSAGDALPTVHRTAPKRVYLDLGFDPIDVRGAQFSDLADVTWSSDNATGHGIEYVRADLAAAPAAQAVPQTACPDCDGTGVDGDADDYGRIIDVECGCCGGTGRANTGLPRAYSEVIAECKAAGMAWVPPDHASGFPGAFDMPEMPAMRRLIARVWGRAMLAAAPAAPQPAAQPGELSADALDAERYRWLRDHGFQHAVVCLGTDFDGDNFVSYRIDFNLPEPAHMKFEDDEWGTADVDAAIDAAMKEQGHG